MELLRRLTEAPIAAWRSSGAVVGLLAALCLCAACGHDPTSTHGDSLTVVQGWSTQKVQRTSSDSSPPAHLDTIHVSAASDRHRVVFGFRDATLPAYTVRRVQGPVHQCGSGRPLELGGSFVLKVRFESARAHTKDGSSTLAQREWEQAFPDGARAAIACDFEGHVVWALGIPSSSTYRVLSDSATGRLAVDVRW